MFRYFSQFLRENFDLVYLSSATTFSYQIILNSLLISHPTIQYYVCTVDNVNVVKQTEYSAISASLVTWLKAGFEALTVVSISEMSCHIVW
jgi:hypothetical protein